MPWKDNISILVDYAHDPESLDKLLKTCVFWKEDGQFDFIIHLLSSDGSGRDNWKKPKMGELSKNSADYTIISTDNYDATDNPQDIMSRLARRFDPSQKNKTWFKILEREQAMEKCLEKAKEIVKKDTAKKILIVSTNVGSEQQLTQPGGLISWDERKIWIKKFEEIV